MKKPKVLFTKTTLNESIIKSFLSPDYQWSSIAVIKTETLPRSKDFALENKAFIFTSGKAVDAFLHHHPQLSQEVQMEKLNIYCVGENSSKKLEIQGLKATFVGKNAEELSSYLLQQSKNKNLLHFCGDLALETFEQTFQNTDFKYEKAIVYKTTLLYPIINEEYDAVVFFSPSGVRSYLKFNTLESKGIFSIGDTTTSELENFTKQPIITSKENNLTDLLKLITKNLSFSGK